MWGFYRFVRNGAENTSSCYMKYFYLSIIIALTYSCSHAPTSAYFGGEIVNPTTDYVHLYWNNTVIDSAKLNENNRFAFQLENLKEGLYHFDHNEYQYIILEKGDSLMVRLNTLDFDESLVFTGEGAIKNNFLMDMFLIYEDEEKAVNKYSELKAVEFMAKIDSLRAMKQDLLKDLNIDHTLSPLSLHIAQSAINYRYFTDMEEYPVVHKRRTGKEQVQELPDHFYSFRKNISYNDSTLTYYSPYFNYLITHFSNLALRSCKKDCIKQKESFRRTAHYSKHKLKLIDSLVSQNKTVRDNLTRNAAFSYFLGRHTATENSEFMLAFKQYAKDNQHQEEINKFYYNVQQMQEGLAIPTLHLVNRKGEKISFSSDTYTKNTIFYFWNYHQRNHLSNILTRIHHLKDKYPDFDYIGINVNSDQTLWLQNIASIKDTEDAKNQYRTDNVEELLSSLVIKNLNKVIVVDKNGKIAEGFANIYYTRHLENTMEAIND